MGRVGTYAAGVVVVAGLCGWAAGDDRPPVPYGVDYQALFGARAVSDAPAAGGAGMTVWSFSFAPRAEGYYGRWRFGYGFFNNAGYGYPRVPAATVEEHEFRGGVTAAWARAWAARLYAGVVVSRANGTEEGVEPIMACGKSSWFARPAAAASLFVRPSRGVGLEYRVRYWRRIKPLNWAYRPRVYSPGNPPAYLLTCDAWETAANVKFPFGRVFSFDVAGAFVRDGAATPVWAEGPAEVFPPANELRLYVGGAIDFGAWNAGW